jgi:hypothetical protein
MGAVSWVSRRWWRQYEDSARVLRQAVEVAQATLAQTQNSLMALRVRADNLSQKCTALETDAVALRDRATQAEIRRTAAETAEALYRVRVNHLERTNAELLTRLVPGLTPTVPVIERPLQTEPGAGIDFEDMGDAAASAAGYRDLHDLPPNRPLRPEE